MLSEWAVSRLARPVLAPAASEPTHMMPSTLPDDDIASLPLPASLESFIPVIDDGNDDRSSAGADPMAEDDPGYLEFGDMPASSVLSTEMVLNFSHSLPGQLQPALRPVATSEQAFAALSGMLSASELELMSDTSGSAAYTGGALPMISVPSAPQPFPIAGERGESGG